MLRRVFGYESGPVASVLRIGVKTVVMYCLVKPFLDAIIYYCTPSKFFKIPRILAVIDQTNRINPPFFPDFPEDQQSRQQNRLHDQLHVNAIHNYDRYMAKRDAFDNDYPQRQNPDMVDHLGEYLRYKYRRQMVQLGTAKKIEDEGGDVTGINNFIRTLEQYKLDELESKVIPRL